MFFFSFLAVPAPYGSSHARDHICATAVIGPTLLFRGGQAGGGPGPACVSRAAHKHEGCFQGRTGSWEAGHLRHRICGGQRVAQEGSPQSRRRAWPQLGVSRVLGRGGRLCALGQRGKPGFRGPDGSWVSCRRGLGLQGDQLLLVRALE